jgi:hypothetical protein
MATVGTYEGLPAEVRTAWSPSGVALCTQVSLRPLSPFPEKYEFTLKSSDDQPGQLDLPVLPPAAYEQVTQLISSSSVLSLTKDWIAAVLPTPLLDPAPALESLQTMSQLAMILQHGDGPYR